MSKLLRVGALLSVCGLVAIAATQLSQSDAPEEVACAPGYSRVDMLAYAREFKPNLTAEQGEALIAEHGATPCLLDKHPEPFAEVAAVGEARSRGVGPVSNHAYRTAIDTKRQMLSAPKQVAGADGTWTEYGTGPLITDDDRFGTAGIGIGTSMGRVDSFAFDEENMRLFVAKGTSGVWMSEADTVQELSDNWVPIGDNLPSLTTSAIEFIPAKDGRASRLVIVSGEHTMGGAAYSGMGGFWSDDLGATWNQATGLPDAALGFEVAVNLADSDEVYIATSKGLFKSTDAGTSFTNVNLPVSPECAGVEEFGPCQFANFVTDVIVKIPGGSTNEAGGEVLAAVGYRAGLLTFPDGTVHSPGNGLYRSDSGDPDTFTKLDVSGDGVSNVGFTTQERIGRTELGQAKGVDQDHNVIYAIVEDAVLFNGGVGVIDAPDAGGGEGVGSINGTALNGIYASTDFGDSWMRLADDQEILNPAAGSGLAALAAINGPGVQAWYNLWVEPDPTRQFNGIPTRLQFGLEEVWQSRTTDTVPQDGLAQGGGADYEVIGVYFRGESCQLLLSGVPACPTNSEPLPGTTTHPDQHDGFWIPTVDASGAPDGGVCMFAGGDGGVYRQCVAQGEEMDNNGWGRGHNEGFYSLLPYGMAVAKDGRAYFGLQDNGSGHIEGPDHPDAGLMFQSLGGDGFFSAVDPDDSDYAYQTIQNAALNFTTDGGLTYSSAGSSPTSPMFANWFVMDPLNAEHLMTGGEEIQETVTGRTTDPWTDVFQLGTSATGVANRMSFIELYGDFAYAGFCGECDILNRTDTGFASGIATNVSCEESASPLTGAGWHEATAAGLPERFVTSIEMDPNDPLTIFVTLAGYAGRSWVPPGSYLDPNPNIGSGNVFMSRDAGETFTNISANLPEVHAQSVILRGDQLIIGTDIGPFISSSVNDLGSLEWDVLGGTTLPNVVTTQIVSHPGNANRIFASTFGRHIWSYDFGPAVEPGPLPVPDLQAACANAGQPVPPPPPVTPPTADQPSGAGGALGLGWLLLTPAAVWLRRRMR